MVFMLICLHSVLCFYAEKKGRILGHKWDIDFKDNPLLFRFHQVLYTIFAMAIFAIVVTQLLKVKAFRGVPKTSNQSN